MLTKHKTKKETKLVDLIECVAVDEATKIEIIERYKEDVVSHWFAKWVQNYLTKDASSQDLCVAVLKLAQRCNIKQMTNNFDWKFGATKYGDYGKKKYEEWLRKERLRVLKDFN